jgi:hypothetical protein
MIIDPPHFQNQEFSHSLAHQRARANTLKETMRNPLPALRSMQLLAIMKRGFATNDENVVEQVYARVGHRRSSGRSALVPIARLLA